MDGTGKELDARRPFKKKKKRKVFKDFLCSRPWTSKGFTWSYVNPPKVHFLFPTLTYCLCGRRLREHQQRDFTFYTWFLMSLLPVCSDQFDFTCFYSLTAPLCVCQVTVTKHTRALTHIRRHKSTREVISTQYGTYGTINAIICIFTVNTCIDLQHWRQ